MLFRLIVCFCGFRVVCRLECWGGCVIGGFGCLFAFVIGLFCVLVCGFCLVGFDVVLCGFGFGVSAG